jgi:hypothetical protein
LLQVGRQLLNPFLTAQQTLPFKSAPR